MEDNFNDDENHEAERDIFMATTVLEETKKENNEIVVSKEVVNRHVELEEQSRKNRQRVFFPHASHVPESKYLKVLQCIFSAIPFIICNNNVLLSIKSTFVIISI